MNRLVLRGSSRGYGLPHNLERKKIAREKKKRGGPPQASLSDRRAEAITELVWQSGLKGLSPAEIGKALEIREGPVLHFILDRYCTRLYKDNGRWYHMDFDITKA